MRALEGLNIIGMKRRKFTRERLATVRSFYQKLFHGPGIFAERLERGAADGGGGSGDRGNSRPSSATASIARCVCRPMTATGIEHGIGRNHDIGGLQKSLRRSA